MGAFITPPTFTPSVPPIRLGSAGQVLTMVNGVPAFAAGGGGGLPPTPLVDSVLCNGPSFGNVPTWVQLSAFTLRGAALVLSGTSQDVIATGTHNDFVPGAPVDNFNQWFVQSITGDVTLTGLIAPVGVAPFGPGGQFMSVTNVGVANTFTLSNLNGGSLAANQFKSVGDVALPPGVTVWLVYDAVDSKWLIAL